MTTDEAQANSDIVTSKMFVFGSPTRVLFDSRSNRSFLSTVFALHVDRSFKEQVGSYYTFGRTYSPYLGIQGM